MGGKFAPEYASVLLKFSKSCDTAFVSAIISLILITLIISMYLYLSDIWFSCNRRLKGYQDHRLKSVPLCQKDIAVCSGFSKDPLVFHVLIKGAVGGALIYLTSAIFHPLSIT
jgi:hypothetical protein